MSERPNRMLEFLTSTAKPEGDACRSNRRRLSSVQVELAWAEGSVWRTIPARLRDISRVGAGLLADSTPPLTRRARLRIVDGEGSPWIEAEILGVEADDSDTSKQRIRMRFEEPCPSFMLRLAVLEHDDRTEEVPADRQEWMTCK